MEDIQVNSNTDIKHLSTKQHSLVIDQALVAVLNPADLNFSSLNEECLYAENTAAEFAAFKYFFEWVDGSKKSSIIKIILDDPLVQNVFIHRILKIFSQQKNRKILSFSLKKFIELLDDWQSFEICQKLFILHHPANEAAVLFLANCLLIKLAGGNFFQALSVEQLAYFTNRIPANDDDTLHSVLKNISHHFDVKISTPEGQDFVVQLINRWQQAIANADAKQVRKIENILLKIYPHILRDEAASKWSWYVQKLSERINQLNKLYTQKKFFYSENAYLIMRQVQKLLKMLEEHPKDKKFYQRHNELTAMLKKISRINVEHKLSLLFTPQHEVSRIFYINPSEVSFDHTINAPKKQLSAYNQLIRSQCFVDEFTHVAVTHKKLAADLMRLKFKFMLPDRSFFYFSKNLSNGQYVLSQYDAQGKYQAEAFQLINISAEAVVAQAKKMLQHIEYDGVGLPQVFIDFFAEFLIVQDSPLYYSEKMYYLFKQAVLGLHANAFRAIGCWSAIYQKIQGQACFFIKWNGKNSSAAQLWIGDERFSVMPFIEIKIKETKLLESPYAIHPLEKFAQAIEIKTRNFSMDLSSENLQRLGLNSNVGLDSGSADFSDQLFDESATGVFLCMKKDLVLDQYDLQTVFIQLERQLQVRGYTSQKIEAILRPLAKKWFKLFYKNSMNTRVLAENIYQDAKKLLIIDLCLINKEVVEKNNFRTFYLMSAAEKKNCLKNLAEMPDHKRQRTADFLLRHNEINVNFFGLRLRDYLISLKNYMNSWMKIYAIRFAYLIKLNSSKKMPRKQAIFNAAESYQLAKIIKEKKSKAIVHAFFAVGREEEPVFNAEELYQLITLASMEGIVVALKDERNKKILMDAPEVLVDLYCYIKLAYSSVPTIMHLINRLIFSDQEFLFDLKEMNRHQYNQLMVMKENNGQAKILDFISKRNNIFHSWACALFLTYAHEIHLNIFSKNIDSAWLMRHYALLMKITANSKRLYKNLVLLLCKTIEAEFLKNPDGSFICRLLTGSKAQAILPEALVKLDKQWLGLEKEKMKTMILHAGQGSPLLGLFEKNAAACMLFLRYALPKQIESVLMEIIDLLSSNALFLKSVPDVILVCHRLNQAAFNSVSLIARLLESQRKNPDINSTLNISNKQPSHPIEMLNPIPGITLFQSSDALVKAPDYSTDDKKNAMTFKPQ